MALLWGAAASLFVSMASAQTPEWSLQALRRLQGGPGAADPQVMAERQRLLDEGELKLASGDTEAAQQAFDRAALMVHAADTELALVRTYMQAGEYRRALAFGAHAAGAHRELPASAALYAWLLQAGGQAAPAGRLLDQALAAAPADAALLQARRQLSAPWPLAQDALAAPPVRVRPYATQAQVPAAALAAGTGLLAADGRHAFLPASLIHGASGLWLRNGLGQTVAATLLRVDAPDGVALVRLDMPLPVPAGLAATPREPFAGSAASLVEYAVSGDAAPAWPWLRLGFFGRFAAVPGTRALGIEVPAGPRGGPVFDAAGRLAGMAWRDAQGVDRLWPGDALAARLGVSMAVVGEGAAAPAAPDAIYEQALRVALQVLVLR